MNWDVADVGTNLLVGMTLWAACLIYVLPLKMRKNFRLRLMIAAGCVIGISMLLEKISYRTMWTELYMAGYYFCVAAVFYFCADVKRFEAWYCAVWTLMTQQFILEISTIFVQMVLGIERKSMVFLLIILIFAAGYTAIALTIARWMPEKEHYHVGPRQIAAAWLLWGIFETLFMLLYIEKENLPMNLMAQFYCITILYLMNALFKKSSMKQELDAIQLLWHQQKEQYQMSKETIELINHKCHDLKHQVRAMRAMQESDNWEEQLKEIEDSVQFYDAIVKTGNEILDVILTEKSLLCEKCGIHINCVANGELLSFMNPVDLYTMFGNALDNAVESVKNLQEEKRLIDLMIYAKQKFLVIRIINPLDKTLKFEDGLPVTTKAWNGYHGYGLKSIRHTIQKYGGYLTVEVKDGCFSLQMMAPLPESKE